MKRLLRRLLIAGIFIPGMAIGQNTSQAAVTHSRAYLPTPVATPKATAKRPPDYNALVAKIQKETEKLRGITLGSTIKPRVLNKPQMADLLRKLLGDELKEPGAQESMIAMKLLGLIPADEDVPKLMQSLLEGQVGGLYNPADKELYVSGAFDPSGFIGGVILSHEITHALQDHEYHLGEYLLDEKDLDRQKAKQCIVEGDATVTMIDWGSDNFTAAALFSIGEAFDAQAQDLEKVPPALLQDMIFSYMGGAQFLNAVRAKHPNDWGAMVFKDPPLSTEQILHPEKYLATKRDNPANVTLKEVADPAYKEIFRNTVGEWMIRLVVTPLDKYPVLGMFTLDPILKYQPSVDAAAGWSGDQFVLLESASNAAEHAISWKTSWESEADAQQFATAFTTRTALFPELAGATVDANGFSAKNFFVRIAQHGSEVNVGIAQTEAGLKAAAALFPQ
ncbi:hypothetical protein BH09SUM1_BH09SUM1_07780 [soil metagenome]